MAKLLAVSDAEKCHEREDYALHVLFIFEDVSKSSRCPPYIGF